ncbi:hypothetical protein D3C75_1001760 [compost metagenome]
MILPHHKTDNIHGNEKQQVQPNLSEQPVPPGQVGITQGIVHAENVRHQVALGRQHHTKHTGEKHRKTKQRILHEDGQHNGHTGE